MSVFGSAAHLHPCRGRAPHPEQETCQDLAAWRLVPYRIFGNSNCWWETLSSVCPFVNTATKWCPKTMANAAYFETVYVFLLCCCLRPNLGALTGQFGYRGDLQPDNINENSAVDTSSTNIYSSPAVVSVPPPAFHRGWLHCMIRPQVILPKANA